MHHWNDSLERGISRAQEIDRLNQDSIVCSATANNFPLPPPAKVSKNPQPCPTISKIRIPPSLFFLLEGQDRPLNPPIPSHPLLPNPDNLVCNLRHLQRRY